MLQLSVEFLEDVDESFYNESTICVFLFIDALHLLLEIGVDLSEDGRLAWKLL